MANETQLPSGQPVPPDLGSGAVPVGFGAAGVAIGGYEDLSEVGRGAFGVVFRARQPEFGRFVAIKVLTGVRDAAARRRFDRERRSVGSLSGHPNIVTVHASGFTADESPYLVMEYLGRGSLADGLAQGPMPWREAIDIGVKLASALQRAHDTGLLHRDIKPENVLLSEGGEPKLADFGIAVLQGATETGSRFTPVHAAPELLAGGGATATADVYSLASTIYTLIAGHAPFLRSTDDSIVSVMARITNDPVPDLRPSGVPDPVCTVLEHAMAKDPAQRATSAAELGRQLAQLLAIASPGTSSTVSAHSEPSSDRNFRLWDRAVHHRPNARNWRPGVDSVGPRGGNEGGIMAAEVISVIVIEDHPLYRQGLAQTVDDDPGLALLDAAERVERVDPDALSVAQVALLDLNLPGRSGPEAVAWVTERGPAVLVVSASDRASDVLDAIAAGAKGYLTKATKAEEISAAVTTVAAGQTYVSPTLASFLLSAGQDTGAARIELTQREKEILALVAQGDRDIDIAKQLFISVATVRSHLDRIRDKTGQRRRPELTRYAIQKGLLKDKHPRN